MNSVIKALCKFLEKPIEAKRDRKLARIWLLRYKDETVKVSDTIGEEKVREEDAKENVSDETTDIEKTMEKIKEISEAFFWRGRAGIESQNNKLDKLIARYQIWSIWQGFLFLIYFYVLFNKVLS